MIRALLLAAAASCSLVAVAAAQDVVKPGKLCWNNPQPRPVCSAILVTNWGVHAISQTATGASNDYSSGSHLRVAADWGVLFPTGPQSALGGTVLASIDNDGLILGPALRYRRWSANQKSSVELAIGMPLSTSSYDAGAVVFGMVKWNPNRFIGVSVRPELRKITDYNCLNVSPYTCGDPFSRKTFALSAGVEIAGAPGAILTGASGVAGFLLLLWYIGSGD